MKAEEIPEETRCKIVAEFGRVAILPSVDEMVELWLATLPEKTRKSAKFDLNTALAAVGESDLLERVQNNPRDVFDELDGDLRMRRFAGTTRNKIKSVFRRWLRFCGIETLPLPDRIEVAT